MKTVVSEKAYMRIQYKKCLSCRVLTVQVCRSGLQNSNLIVQGSNFESYCIRVACPCDLELWYHYKDPFSNLYLELYYAYLLNSTTLYNYHSTDIDPKFDTRNVSIWVNCFIFSLTKLEETQRETTVVRLLRVGDNVCKVRSKGRCGDCFKSREATFLGAGQYYWQVRTGCEEWKGHQEFLAVPCRLVAHCKALVLW